MNVQRFKAESGWTMRDNVTREFVAIVTFREPVFINGLERGTRAVDCVAIESDSHADCLNAALAIAKTDARESTMRCHQTWIIAQGLPHAGKRDNKRIN